MGARIVLTMIAAASCFNVLAEPKALICEISGERRGAPQKGQNLASAPSWSEDSGSEAKYVSQDADGNLSLDLEPFLAAFNSEKKALETFVTFNIGGNPLDLRYSLEPETDKPVVRIALAHAKRVTRGFLGRKSVSTKDRFLAQGAFNFHAHAAATLDLAEASTLKLKIYSQNAGLEYAALNCHVKIDTPAAN